MKSYYAIIIYYYKMDPEDEVPKKIKKQKKCKYCNVALFAAVDCKAGVCSICKNNDRKTITASNVKKKYGLDAKSNKSLSTIKKRYYVDEIEKYVEELIKSGDEKIIKKKQQNEAQNLIEQKTKEINKFIKNNIENKMNANINKIKSEYVTSKLLVLSDVSQKIKDIDNKITTIKQNKIIFFDNLASIVAEKLNDTEHWKRLCLFDEFMQLKNSNVFTKYINNLKKNLMKSFDVFDNTIVSKGEILKAEIANKIIDEISNKLVNKIKKKSIKNS